MGHQGWALTGALELTEAQYEFEELATICLWKEASSAA